MKRNIWMILILALTLLLTGCTQTQETGKPTLSGLHNFTYTIGDEEPDYLTGITASDAEDGDLTSSIYVDDSQVDYENAGAYDLTYAVIDSEGHLTRIGVTVTVVEPGDLLDTTAPTIMGTQNMYYTIGSIAPNYLNGVTAYDDIDGNVTASLTVDDHLVDYETVGNYIVTYAAADEAGNIGSVSIFVIVQAPVTDTTLHLYYLNDFHGAILPDDNSLGLAAIANLIMTDQQTNPDTTIFITGGDMLQGNIMSNYYFGASVIDILNNMGLDAFVLGNHEFDWGLDVVLDYFNPMSDAPVHATFPLLAANLIETSSGERPEYVDPYAIIERQGYKIGVIGTIGYGLESSIAAGRVAGYEFLEPVSFVEYYATYLRTVEDVDLVIAVNHGDSDYYNHSVADLTGDARVDMIYNGHSHQTYIEPYVRDGMDTYFMQSGANGSSVGYTSFHITDGIYDQIAARNLNTLNETLLTGSNTDIQAIIDSYQADIADLISTNIITAGEYMSQSALTEYMAKIMRVKTESDIAFHNYGGTRTSVSQGQDMTVALAYEIFPFDNVVKTTELLGSTVKTIMSWTSVGYDTDITNFDDQTYYKVATNDYIYDGNPNTFGAGQNPINTYLLLRDMFIEVLEDLRDQGNSMFYLSLEIPVPLSIDTFILPINKESELVHDIMNA